MANYRTDPWSLLSQLSQELNRAFELPAVLPGAEQGTVTASDWVPAVDIREDEDRFVIYADVPGVAARDIQVNMENGILTISGERPRIGEDERPRYKRLERPRGTFLRRFTLPDTANAEGITARSEHGVLEVSIPKQSHVQPRKITVEG